VFLKFLWKCKESIRAKQNSTPEAEAELGNIERACLKKRKETERGREGEKKKEGRNRRRSSC
jgi:hypothetical protein